MSRLIQRAWFWLSDFQRAYPKNQSSELTRKVKSRAAI